MKRNKLVVIAVMLFTIFVLSSCNFEQKSEPYSMCHKSVFAGSDDNFYVTLIYGIKEKDYKKDGVVNETYSFVTLSALPLSYGLFNKDYCYDLQLENETKTGKFSADLFGSGYVAEIDFKGDLQGEIKCKITCQDNEYNVILTNRIQGIDYKTATEKAKELLLEELQEYDSYEITAKYISNNKSIESPYYWYVSFIKSEKEFVSVLLNGETGELIAKKRQ